MTHTNLNLNIVEAFLNTSVNILRQSLLERARVLNSATELNTDQLVETQVETRQNTEMVKNWIHEGYNDNVQAVVKTALVETIELTEVATRKISASALKREQKTRMLIRSVLPIIAEMAIKHAKRFEDDVLIAASAFYEEAQLAVLRFDAKKANRASFAEFVESSLKLRISVLADEVCDGSRKTHEAVRHLKGLMNEMGLSLEHTDASSILRALRAHFSEIGETVPATLNKEDKIQVLLDLVYVTTSNGNFLSLDAVMSDGDSDGTPRRLIDVIEEEIEVHKLQQIEDEDAVRPVLEMLEGKGIDIETIAALGDKISTFVKLANAKTNETMADPQWAAVITETIGVTGLMCDISVEIGEELGINSELAYLLGQTVVPFYRNSLALNA